MDEIKKQRNNYIKYGLGEVVILMIAISILTFAFDIPAGIVSCISLVPALYATTIIVAAGLVWRKVAKHPDYIPSFHMGVSTVRLLLALAVIFIYILNLDTEAPDYNPNTKVLFLLTFGANYILLLIHHFVFHSRLNKQQKNETD